MNETISAGPAPYRMMVTPSGPTCPAAAVPSVEKIPAPMTAPILNITRSPTPSSRRRPLVSLSAIRSAMGFLPKRVFIARMGDGRWKMEDGRWTSVLTREPSILHLRSSIGLDEQRCKHQRDRREQLDQHVQRRARRVLERIANRVAHYRRLVRVGLLAAVHAGLD